MRNIIWKFFGIEAILKNQDRQISVLKELLAEATKAANELKKYNNAHHIK